MSFSSGKWQEDAWQLVKSPRWPNIGRWIQKDDHIENAIPADASEDDMLGKRAPETYASMLWKTPVTGSFTVSATMDFAHRMAPLIVLADGTGADVNGYPEYRQHWEIVLYDEGINVWHHMYQNGKPSWHRAAVLKHAFPKNVRQELSVHVDYTVHGAQVMITCGGETFGYLEPDLPKKLQIGITACEGLNRFYDFKLKNK